MTTLTTAYKNYIAGEWVSASSGATFENSNPATNDVLNTFPLATKDDTQRAIEAAKAALPKWAICPAQRGAILDKAPQLIECARG